MYRKKHYGRTCTTVGKENLDGVCLESSAKEKLNTFSEDQPSMLVHDDEFSGWADGNILHERINRTQKSHRSPVEPLTLEDSIPSRIFAKRDCRSRRVMPSQITEPTECVKTGIYILKKEVEFLEAENPTQDAVDKSKFPKREDLIISQRRPTMQQCCYPTNNNFFSSRDKYSQRDTNRKRIKNLRKLSLKYPHNYASLLLSPNYCKALLQETVAVRPRSGRATEQSNNKRHHSHRMHSEKTDSETMRLLSELENTRPRYIPSSFKKCRMNKRNKSAQSQATEASELQALRRTAEPVGKVKGRPPQQVGPLDDLLRIRFPDFF